MLNGVTEYSPTKFVYDIIKFVSFFQENVTNEMEDVDREILGKNVGDKDYRKVKEDFSIAEMKASQNGEDGSAISEDVDGTQTIVKNVNVDEKCDQRGVVIAARSETGEMFVAVKETEKLFGKEVPLGLPEREPAGSVKEKPKGSTSGPIGEGAGKWSVNRFEGYECKHCKRRHPKLKDHHAHQAICQADDKKGTDERRVKVLQTEADREREMRRMRDELESKEQELIVLRSKNKQLNAKIHAEGSLERKIRSQELTIRFLRENSESLNTRLQAALDLIANNENNQQFEEQ